MQQLSFAEDTRANLSSYREGWRRVHHGNRRGEICNLTCNLFHPDRLGYSINYLILLVGAQGLEPWTR